MLESTRIKKLTAKYEKKFASSPTHTFTSPGRIELLGNHTDHNNGLVLVSSVNLNIIALVGKNDTNKVVCYSSGFKKVEVSLKNLKLKESEYGTSISLIKGVLFKMKEKGYNIGGFNICLDSSIPVGAGVSSSASYEVLFAKIISVLFNNDEISAFTLATIAQFAESSYFNKPCGLLDQSGIALGGINYIDFKNTTTPIIKNLKVKIKGYQFILINPGDDHTSLTHCYAQIKDDMKEIASYFSKSVLREVDENDFYASKNILIKMNERAYLRAEHYFEENKRVAKAYDALVNKDFETFLNMLNESGLSSYNKLKNCYVKSEDEKLPTALRKVKEIDPTCYSRVHGGGFAGTMLMIVKKDKINTVLPLLQETFGKNNVIKVSLVEYGTCLKQN